MHHRGNHMQASRYEVLPVPVSTRRVAFMTAVELQLDSEAHVLLHQAQHFHEHPIREVLGALEADFFAEHAVRTPRLAAR